MRAWLRFIKRSDEWLRLIILSAVFFFFNCPFSHLSHRGGLIVRERFFFFYWFLLKIIKTHNELAAQYKFLYLFYFLHIFCHRYNIIYIAGFFAQRWWGVCDLYLLLHLTIQALYYFVSCFFFLLLTNA